MTSLLFAYVLAVGLLFLVLSELTRQSPQDEEARGPSKRTRGVRKRFLRG